MKMQQSVVFIRTPVCWFGCTDEFNVQNARRVDPKGVIWKGELLNLKPQGLMHVRLPSGKKHDGQWDNGYLKRVLSVQNCDGTHAPYIVH